MVKGSGFHRLETGIPPATVSKPKKQRVRLPKVGLSWLNFGFPSMSRPFLVLSGVIMILSLFIFLLIGAAFGREAGKVEVLSGITATLAPVTADFNKRYAALESQYKQSQADLAKAKADVTAAQKAAAVSEARASSLQSENHRLATELVNLQVLFRGASGSKSSFEQAYYQSQQEVQQLRGKVTALTDKYNALYGKLSSVNDRKSDTVNVFTATERTAFYLIWDKWWEIVNP